MCAEFVLSGLDPVWADEVRRLGEERFIMTCSVNKVVTVLRCCGRLPRLIGAVNHAERSSDFLSSFSQDLGMGPAQGQTGARILSRGNQIDFWERESAVGSGSVWKNGAGI